VNRIKRGILSSRKLVKRHREGGGKRERNQEFSKKGLVATMPIRKLERKLNTRRAGLRRKANETLRRSRHSTQVSNYLYRRYSTRGKEGHQGRRLRGGSSPPGQGMRMMVARTRDCCNWGKDKVLGGGGKSDARDV